MIKRGDQTYIGNQPQVWYGHQADLIIGNYCSISDGVTFMLGGNHRPDWLSTFPFDSIDGRGDHPGHPATKGNIVIGNDVWIGLRACILSGVKIGDGAVVSAFSVVAKDVPPYGIVAGNPARLIRFRFDEGTVRRLLKLAWWNWPPELLEPAKPILQSGDLPRLYVYYLDKVERKGAA